MSKTATYSLIASNTLGSAAGNVTFSSIPATFTDLILITQHTCATGTNNQLVIQPNSNSDAVYSRTLINSGGGAERYFSEQAIYISYLANNTDITTSINNFLDYANTTTFKTVLTYSNSGGGPRAEVTLWRKTPEAISSLYIYPYSGTFATGSIFKLYGIQAGNA